MIEGLKTTEVRCKKGRPAWIRPATESDAEGLFALEFALIADGRGQVLGPEELPAEGPHKDRLFGRLQKVDAFYVACLDTPDGPVVGQGSVNRLGPKLVRHVGNLEVGVHPDHQERGLGRAICEVLIDSARLAGVERLQLYVRADNVRAIRLYRSLGFESEVLRKRFVKLSDGNYVDDWSMVRWISPLDSGSFS